MGETDKEKTIYGETWDAFHGGYFSDPAIADPLVRQILDAAATSKPRVVVDLGGGTGYVLSQLRGRGIGPEAVLVNMDSSDAQIAAVRSTGFTCIRGSVGTFQRSEVGSESERFLFTIRSVLHYFGREGLGHILRHIRAQAKPGEFFVHQTASFRSRRDADCLNSLYRMMGTQKWYPTVDAMCRCLKEEGWEVTEVAPCRPLVLTCGDLAQRYGLDPSDLAGIGRRLCLDFPDCHAVLRHEAGEFRAFLHYWIYVCRAQ